MDRKTYKLSFTLARPPDWVCPNCAKGILRIEEKSFFKEEPARSRYHDHPAWEPEWIEWIYCCLLYCPNEKCKEVVASTGVGSVDFNQFYNEDGQPDYSVEDRFRPKYFEPPLKIIYIPDETPKSVTEPIETSFRLFLSSPAAAANSIRIAVEQLLTELKVKRFRTVGGKRRYVNLHQRIDLLPKSIQR
jgi:hypothetical protein